MYQFNSRLYHGTVSQIDKVDVSLGRGNKDFGKGFIWLYLKHRQSV